MANPITNLPLPPNLLTHLSNLTNPNSTNSNSTSTLPNTPTSKTTSISPKSTIILLTLTLGIPTLLIIIFSTIHYISNHLRHQKRKSPTNTNTNTNTNPSSNTNTNPPNNGPILPLDARNMGILGRQINPEDELELDFVPGYRRYGSWESVSSSILSTPSSRMGAVDLVGGEVSPPPVYVERERERMGERDLDVEVGNGGGVGDGIVVVPPPVYHPLM